MKVRGWIYIITNNAMPGLLKIGYSTKDPFLRAQEFDGSGMPHHYEVIYDALIFEPREVEQKVHSILKDKREGKEWFRCSIGDSIKAIRLASVDKQIMETTHQQIIETIQDTSMNLMWAAKDNGNNINWSNAKSYCENYREGCYSDWRMPTLDELEGLYDSGIYKNVIQYKDIYVWAIESRESTAAYSYSGGSEAALFHFFSGFRHWLPQSIDFNGRALPVRSGK